MIDWVLDAIAVGIWLWFALDLAQQWSDFRRHYFRGRR